MGEARAGGASRALGHSVICCKWGRDTHVCTFFQATGLFHWTALGSCCPRLGAEDPQAINPLYFRKITPPPHPFQGPNPPPSLNFRDRKLAAFPGGRQEAREGAWSYVLGGGPPVRFSGPGTAAEEGERSWESHEGSVQARGGGRGARPRAWGGKAQRS